MAKPKLQLTANPTFKAIVGIPVPGGKPVAVEFVFKHRARDAYDEWVESIPKMEEPDLIMSIVSGWDLDDSFDRDNVEKLVTEYIGSARAIFDKYMAENNGARTGN